MKNQYTYQLLGNGKFYSSFKKAHKKLCSLVGKNEEEFKHYCKSETKDGRLIYHYEWGWGIAKITIL